MVLPRARNGIITVGLIFLGGCGSPGLRGPSTSQRALLFDGLGSHRRPVTTTVPEAQRYFDQGLTWCYAFNHDEAIRSFREAAKRDPNCAMAWWGVAYANGPHINNPLMPKDRSQAAWDALQKATALRDNASPVERDLIHALSKRYAYPIPEDRAALDRAYADAMRDVWKRYPNDADVGTLFAESMMDLRPWDLWQPDGKPHDGTEEIIATLDAVIRIDPNNPGANHLTIHTLEASPNPVRAEAAADRLRKSVPAAGHLVHMPSHIDVLTGKWELAASQNQAAIEADRQYRAEVPQQDFYRVYMNHNHHMLMFAAMMEGDSKTAIGAARHLVDSIPKDYARKNVALVDPYFNAVADAQMRFGRWEEVLRQPRPASQFRISNAMWHFSRGVAYAAIGKVAEAEKEQAAFEKAVAKVPKQAVFAINPAHTILDIARHMLAGEIAYRRGSVDEAISQLRQAVAIEDGLKYMEPPEWVQPVRHTLGAVLLSAGRNTEAEAVYRDDLKEWPNNGWSLYGLSQALRKQGRNTEADAAEKSFRQAWARADIQMTSSCLCVTLK